MTIGEWLTRAPTWDDWGAIEILLPDGSVIVGNLEVRELSEEDFDVAVPDVWLPDRNWFDLTTAKAWRPKQQ